MRIPYLEYLQCLQSLHAPLPTLLFAALLYLVAPASAQAQTQNNAQPTYIFASVPSGAASQVAAFSVDSAGALKAVPGSPFTETREGGFVAVDPLNQFVFVLNAASNDISVFAIDPATGVLAELSAAGSPFAAPAPQSGEVPPTQPTAMATFKGANGDYLYVAYRNGPAPSPTTTGAIVQFQIGTVTEPLNPVSTTTFEATPINIVINPQGFLYAALQIIQNPNLSVPILGVDIFAIDSTTGALGQPNSSNSNLKEASIALNPAGTFLFDGAGSSAASMIESAPIQSDGSTGPPEQVVLGSSSQPSAMLVDGAGRFLYVREGAQTVVYAIDPTTGALATPSLPVPQLPLSPGNTVADPLEAYLYSLQRGQLQVLHIDPISGALAQIGPTQDISDGGGSGGLAITNSAAPTVAGLNAGFAPPALSFPDTSATQPSQPELIHLTNTGTQPLDITLSSIVITGADAADFVLTQSCTTPLQPHASCTISIIFTPAIAAPRQAMLTVTDAAGTQSALLSGTGLSAQPGASLAPSTLTFAPTAIASSAASQSVVLINSGDATLHISSILAGGINSTDFAIASATGSTTAAPAVCTTTTPYPPNASCSITIAFTPLGAGARSASIIIADDAPGSTQTVLL
ncbi:MAG TPA: choice-of-anchor D domain-containing protein, partial [Candidatus Acidoferrum sp.]|nr:choice-of-anchor D domain-containing protein [Candidatus Acidoferrum sp.]